MCYIIKVRKFKAVGKQAKKVVGSEFSLALRQAFIGTLDDIGDRLVLLQPEVLEEKPKEGGEVVTSADLEMDGFGVAAFLEILPPEWAIYTEESGVVRPFTGKGPVVEAAFDFLCGSKIYLEGQHYGVAVLASVMVDGEVMAMFARDVFSGAFYYVWPVDGKAEACRRYPNGSLEVIKKKRTSLSLKDGRAIMRRHPATHCPMVEALAHPDSGIFGDLRVVSDYSLPLTLIEFANSGAGAYLLLGSPARPKKFKKHDTAPFLLWLEVMGFAYLRSSVDGRCLERFELQVAAKIGEPIYLCHPTIVVHDSAVAEIRAAWARLFAKPDCP